MVCMKIEQENLNLVINEWQLGQQLNTAVHNGTREKFNLLLSMLSDDARDFSQFSVPSAAQSELTEAKQNLRDTFSLPDTQPLVNKGISPEQAGLMNHHLKTNKLSSIRLQYLLNNEALLSRNEAVLIDSDIKDNLSFLSQHRLAESLQTEITSPSSIAEQTSGIDINLIREYQALDLDNNPISVTYM